MKESYLANKIAILTQFIEYIDEDKNSELNSETVNDLKEELTHAIYLYDRFSLNNGFEE